MKLTREEMKQWKKEKAVLGAKLAPSRAVRPPTSGPNLSVDDLVRIQRLRGEQE